MGNMKDIGLLDCEDRPSIEENFKRVQAGGGGGGKIKPEQLPDGYPYVSTEETTVEYDPESEPANLDGFPAFKVGDTVELKVDGVEYSLVAFDYDGVAVIGDDIMGGTDEYGWTIACMDGVVAMMSVAPCTIGYTKEITHEIAEEFLPPVTPAVFSKVVPSVEEVFGNVIVVGGKSSTCENPYPNKITLGSMDIDTLNAMLNGTHYVPEYIMCDGNLAQVHVKSDHIMVKWSEFNFYSTSGNSYEFTGVQSSVYLAKIHEDTENPGTIVSEYAYKQVANAALSVT